MKSLVLRIIAILFVIPALLPATVLAQSKGKKPAAQPATAKVDVFKPQQKETKGSVTVEGHVINYDAYAGTLIIHPHRSEVGAKSEDHSAKSQPPEASMFYVAYFKSGEKNGTRPLTFLYNGGPGSSTIWLHMGAFGPRRVVTADHTHTPPAPYRLVNNEYSLLDASDLVFIDAPGTGFSRIRGKGGKKAFLGVDEDAHAFSEFIMQFLTKYDRWNSPKYLFGESYGTTRSAVLSNLLETHDNIDLNGVILLSQILNFDLSADGPNSNPGINVPYELALPTYAATAWYHHKLPNNPKELQPLLKEVEHFALTDYADALAQGSELPEDQRHAIAEKLHEYTGLPVAYIEKANLRINGGEFEKTLQGPDVTTGRLDTRFSGPTYDPLSRSAEYDPQEAAISSAYVAAFNGYVRQVLKYGQDQHYRPQVGFGGAWDQRHQGPGGHSRSGRPNVMPDLAQAMKYNPDLKVMLNSGYYDLATPFFEGMYEMHQLPMPVRLQKNIEIKHYQSGHMVYVHVPALKALHDNVAAFIQQSSQQK